MKIAFYTHTRENIRWIGDERALEVMRQGLYKLGHEAFSTENLEEIEQADFVFLSNTFYDLTPFYHALKLLQKPYGVVCFQENVLQYYGAAQGMVHYVKQMLSGQESVFQLERLLENPDIIHYFASLPRLQPLLNYPVLKEARVCIANSPTEAHTIKRDCPEAHTHVVFFTPGYLEEKEYSYSDTFLKYVGLKRGEYILQVGRLQARKNQLSSILATRNVSLPLVFISSHLSSHDYAKLCIETILRWRKAPTLILSHDLPSLELGCLKIIHLEKKDSLSVDLLVSAYQNAGLYLHPAFQELPGYVYLEAAKLGVPTIASTWTTVKDYFLDEGGRYTLDERIVYCEPHHINALEAQIAQAFGKRFSPSEHPVLQRTARDVAQDLLEKILIPSHSS